MRVTLSASEDDADTATAGEEQRDGTSERRQDQAGGNAGKDASAHRGLLELWRDALSDASWRVQSKWTTPSIPGWHLHKTFDGQDLWRGARRYEHWAMQWRSTIGDWTRQLQVRHSPERVALAAGLLVQSGNGSIRSPPGTASPDGRRLVLVGEARLRRPPTCWSHCGSVTKATGSSNTLSVTCWYWQVALRRG